MHLRSKREYSFEDFSKTKKMRLGKREETINLDNVINLRMPHIGEQIFTSLETDNLIQCLQVSYAWKVLAENVLLKKWKGKMFDACANGKSRVVKLLLENYNSEDSGLNDKGRSGCRGWTPFMIACANGHKKVVELLLKQSIDSIDVNEKDEFRNTPFLMACQNGQIEVVQLLLNQPIGSIDLNVKDWNWQTPLMFASWQGHKDVVKILLDQEGIELDEEDIFGNTALKYAYENGHNDVARLLLEHSKKKGIPRGPYRRKHCLNYLTLKTNSLTVMHQIDTFCLWTRTSKNETEIKEKI